MNFLKYIKRAIITPLYKTGDPHKLTNYQPIPLVSAKAKVIEKCGNIQFN